MPGSEARPEDRAAFLARVEAGRGTRSVSSRPAPEACRPEDDVGEAAGPVTGVWVAGHRLPRRYVAWTTPSMGLDLFCPRRRGRAGRDRRRPGW
ncbi:hypothetical protein SAMN05444320_106191 [Streptoalloteichus hindustanus]|uniref:Uncharacterized protein n=1 Tax=Streptoalloteichus hindustanus TaxID=2017 RepID=A0A1M5GN31_STRHI|nr:hypothetical protein SAMN05444320_106191 [Streptoalloteichus hindustanus]